MPAAGRDVDAMTRPFFTSDIQLAQSPNLETADRHYEGFDFAVLVDEHVIDLADLGVEWITDVLTGLELIRIQVGSRFATSVGGTLTLRGARPTSA
jgi:hypothetical protein